MRAVRALHERITPLLHVTEIRTMRADDLWLSPAYARDTVGIHFTWHRDERIYDVLPDIEKALLPMDARPHWGKVTCATSAEVTAAFPRWGEFTQLVREVDPQRRFRSPFVTRLMGESA
jgi:xylitol oxidase